MTSPLIAEPSVPSDATILRQFIEFRLGDLHTAMPGEVVAYYPDENTCDVRPLLKRVFVDSDGVETPESCPIIPHAPICYPRGGGFRMTWPLTEGDIVLLVFAERSIDQWSQVGGELVPNVTRKHDLNDAVAVPGISPLLSAIRGLNLTDLVVGTEDGSIELRLNAVTKQVSITGATVQIGGTGALSVARVGDQVSIDPAENAAFYAWIAAASSAGPGVVPPFTGPIVGKIITGSAKVSST